MWIYQGMNWSSSSITHHPQSFPLFSLLRWEILDNLIKRCKHCVTFQWYGNHVIEGVSKRCWLEWSINMPSCATHSCKKKKILSFTSLTWQLTILLLNSCNLKNTLGYWASPSFPATCFSYQMTIIHEVLMSLGR